MHRYRAHGPAGLTAECFAYKASKINNASHKYVISLNVLWSWPSLRFFFFFFYEKEFINVALPSAGTVHIHTYFYSSRNLRDLLVDGTEVDSGPSIDTPPVWHS